MDETLIKNWNKKVQRKDTVYHLGDFALGKNDVVKKYRNRLNGKIHIIFGNHDYQNKIPRISNTIFSSSHDLLSLKYNRKDIILCHYSMRVWPKSQYNSWQLYAHSHGNLEPIGKSWDVGVDVNNYEPLSFDEIKSIMAKRPDNFNFKLRRKNA